MKIKIKYAIIFVLIFLSIGILMGKIFFGNNNNKNDSETPTAETVSEQIWTCSMHPQIRQTEPGDCPICNMELIPLETEAEGIDPDAISMSSTAMELANVQTSIVGLSAPSKDLTLNGKVVKDERLTYSQSSHISGRVDRLIVSFTGAYVSKNQIIAYIYSPELVTAQEELLKAYVNLEDQRALFESAKSKLYNWKVTDEQINSILESGEAIESFPILSDFSGYITEIKIKQGDYVQKGTPFFEISNLSNVWIVFELYESDLSFVKIGDKINYEIQALPGETFEGKISFIDPIINPETRVLKARIDVNNYSMKLKPEMFVLGTLKSDLTNISDQITIPKSSVLWTGKRSIVYVKHLNSSGVSFKMREVVLGAPLNDSYIIEAGLEIGEEIAISGAFSIDAAAQLAGKPSMMNPKGGKPNTGHNHGGDNHVGSSQVNEEKIDIEHKDHNMESMSETVQTENSIKHEMFFVDGLCGMCKDRIENAAMSVNGVHSANWEQETKTLHVEFDDGLTNLTQIHKSIAKAGHDTKIVKAETAIYESLPDCCKYRE